ncbi:MAG: type I 3-dehydroquinate dehydratase [Bacillota bacterium]|nr:type I 3-dehydroquinate dehydratase [Bacillota bacterium]
MRKLSKIKIQVKGKTFGGEKLLTCLPLVSESIEQATELIKLNPDVLEWRVDFFNNLDYQNQSDLIEAMKELSKLTNNIPIIFTCRHIAEGGKKEIKQKDRIKIIEKALETGLADIIDVEMLNDKEFLEEIKALVKKHNKYLILSHHNFKETPNENFILNKIIEGEKLGADITKLAVMANSYGDVLKLFNATYEARISKVEIPIITMSMGEYGKITRVFGEFFGIDMSFAVGKGVSAPGQMPVEDVRKMLELMNN